MHLRAHGHALVDALVSWGLVGMGLLLVAVALSGYLGRLWPLDGRVMQALRRLVLGCILAWCLWESARFFLWHGH